MLFHVCYDEFSYIYQPHGTEPEFWSTTLEGSEMLKAAGWRPFEMHRVSRHLHLSLLTGGHLEPRVSDPRAFSYIGNPGGDLNHQVIF